MVAVCTMVRLLLNSCCLYNGKTYMCLQSDKYVLPKNKRTTVSYMHQIVKNNRRKIIFDDFNRNGNQLNA